MRRPLQPLHLVTDDAVLAHPDFAARAAAALEAGGPRIALHLRGPATAGRPLHRLAEALAERARRTGSVLLVNDRVDVALAAGADGVHLGRRGLRLADARRLLGPGALLGASVHSADEARDAAGADFLLVGPLFATPSHPAEPAAGLALLREAGVAGRPRIGIGGVTAGRAAEVVAAGAAGVAAIRAVWQAPDAAAAVHQFLAALGDDDVGY